MCARVYSFIVNDPLNCFFPLHPDMTSYTVNAKLHFWAFVSTVLHFFFMKKCLQSMFSSIFSFQSCLSQQPRHLIVLPAYSLVLPSTHIHSHTSAFTAAVTHTRAFLTEVCLFISCFYLYLGFSLQNNFYPVCQKLFINKCENWLDDYEWCENYRYLRAQWKTVNPFSAVYVDSPYPTSKHLLVYFLIPQHQTQLWLAS